MKFLWDAVGTEFGGRHELYERNYAGAPETIRVLTWQMAQANGQAEQFKGFAEQCMAEYDLDGWTVPDLITPDDVNLFLRKPRCPPWQNPGEETGMTAIPNKARERLAAGQLALGMALRQARTVEIGRVLAACGFDFAFIDMEHNTMSIDTAAQIAVACHDAGVTPLVRVPGYEHYLATRLLDAGAMGIVFPHVDTPEHARQLVSNCKYPPMGHRSLGGPMAQLGFRPYPRAESTAMVNRETLLVMMLETPAAIDNADAIAAVPGVDVLLIGTNDLTLEMGLPGKYDDPRVVNAYEKVIAACERHGKYPGMGGIYDHPTMEKYVKVGARFILCGSDLSFVMAGGQARADFLRGIKAE